MSSPYARAMAIFGRPAIGLTTKTMDTSGCQAPGYSPRWVCCGRRDIGHSQVKDMYGIRATGDPQLAFTAASSTATATWGPGTKADTGATAPSFITAQ